MTFPTKKHWLFTLLIIIFAVGILGGCQSDSQPGLNGKRTEIKVFLVDLAKPNVPFTKDFVKETGCGDHLVSMKREVLLSDNFIKAALEELFSLKGDTGEFYNSLSLSDLKVKEVILNDKKVTVYLQGSYALAGDCSGSRFVDQIKETVLQFQGIEEAEIYVDERPLESFLSLMGDD